MHNAKKEYRTTDEMLEMLKKSDDWVILRKDKNGTHIHLKQNDSIALIPFVLTQFDEVWDYVKQSIYKYKNNKN